MRAPAEQLVFARESGGYGRGSAREPRDDGSERRGPSKKLIAAPTLRGRWILERLECVRAKAPFSGAFML